MRSSKKMVFIIITVVLFLVAATIARYIMATQLCDDIRAGKPIETTLSDCTTLPRWLSIIAPFLEWQGPRIPLVEACYYRNVQAVEVLLDNGADPNFFMNWLSPLEAAYWNGPSGQTDEQSLMIIQLLVEAGADVNAHAGEEPAIAQLSSWIAAGNNNPYVEELVLYLLDNGASDRDEWGGTVLHDAVRGGNAELVRRLLEKYDYDVNDTGFQGKTPLILAVSYLDRSATVEMIETLIEFGADMSMTDDFGKTALDYTVENGYAELIDLLK